MKFFTKYIPLLMVFALAAGFASCGDDEPDNGEPDMVYVTSGANTSVNIGYDATESFKAVKFETTGEWAVDICEADSRFIADETKKPDWLAMYPNKGGSGSWECELMTSPNHTVSPRYAVVTVSTARASVTFKVKQEGMPNGGGGSIIPNPEN